MAYRYDLHCHTKEGSKCSDISVRDMAALYHEMGYSGICITNHFTNGMNPLADDAPWSDRVNLSHEVYQKAREEGEKLSLSVFFGIEYSLAPDIDRPSITTGTDFLIFNIEKEWLLNNKDAFREKPEGMFKKIHDAGGFVIHAHPMFGEELMLFPYYVDAVEIINGNGGVNDAFNENAKAYAGMYGLTETAGTDIHRFDHKIMAGVETETLCSTIGDLVRVIKEKRAKPFSMVRQITDYWTQKQLEASEARKRNI